jgi:hypothetical protein
MGQIIDFFSKNVFFKNELFSLFSIKLYYFLVFLVYFIANYMEKVKNILVFEIFNLISQYFYKISIKIPKFSAIKVSLSWVLQNHINKTHSQKIPAKI